MTAKLKIHSTRASLGAKITLYHLDLSMFGEVDMYFFKGHKGSPAVSMDGQVYVPMAVQAKGFKITGKGRLPTPTITVGDPNASLSAYIASHDDLLGAILTRTKTYVKYLDGEEEADHTQLLPPEVYEFVKIESQKNDRIKWRLESFLSQRGVELPKRLIVQNHCPFSYRRLVDNAFTTDQTCPYVGDSYFDTADDATTQENDNCSKTLSGCRARPHPNGIIPFGGFPGAARMK